MDSAPKLAPCRNERGMIILYAAIFMMFLFAFLGLAVDFSYRHVAKGELQNAADSAALAGATKLPDPALARATAVIFAANNSAAGSPVTILSSGADALSDSNDVTLGNYNPTLNPAYLAGGDPGGTPPRPINAVQVQARRTEESAGAAEQSKVDLFFSNLFGLPKIGVSATAIAQRVARAGGYFMLSRQLCEAAMPVSLSPGANNMAWTSLQSVPTGPGINVSDLICGVKIPDIDVCAYPLYTMNGSAASVFQDMEADFYDPDYDVANKTLGAGGQVTAWTIIVPVAAADNPTVQPEPYPVQGYAKIRLTRACGPGGGNPCSGERAFFSPPGVCTGNEQSIVIDSIECVSCEDSAELLGAKAYLVQ